MRTWTFDRHPAGDGPWADEPDKAQWIDESTGLDCLILRNFAGALCGYVGVPPGHPWHGCDTFDLDLDAGDVHGGLTFAGPCREGAGDDAICHVPQPGRPAEVWWLGFDCAHAGDYQPIFHVAPPLADLRKDWSYKTFGFVRAECAALAYQVAAAANQPPPPVGTDFG